MSNNILLLFISLCLLSCSANKSREDLRIKNITIVDIENGVLIAGRDIQIKDGKIYANEAHDSKRSDDSSSIDGSGKYLVPGFRDMHVHIRGGKELIQANKDLLPLYIVNGVTTVRDAGGDLTPSVMEWNMAGESGMLMSPRIYTSGPKLDGPDPTWEGSIELNDINEVSAAIDSLESIGVDYVKIYESSLSADIYLEIIRETQRRGIKVTGHMPMDVPVRDAIDAGLDGIEHLYYVMKGTSDREEEIITSVKKGEIGFWNAVEELMESYDEPTAIAFYRKLAENEVYVTPTLHIDDILSYLQETDHSTDPYLSYIPEPMQQTYQRRLRSAMRRDKDAIAFEDKMNKFFKQITKDMSDAGVKLLPGSDSGAFNSFVYPGYSLHKELEAFQTAGISTSAILQAEYINSSKFLGLGTDFYGKGSVADLVILNKDPLEDIANTQDIYGVVDNGKYYDQTELKTILENLNEGQY